MNNFMKFGGWTAVGTILGYIPERATGIVEVEGLTHFFHVSSYHAPSGIPPKLGDEVEVLFSESGLLEVSFLLSEYAPKVGDEVEVPRSIDKWDGGLLAKLIY